MKNKNQEPEFKTRAEEWKEQVDDVAKRRPEFKIKIPDPQPGDKHATYELRLWIGDDGTFHISKDGVRHERAYILPDEMKFVLPFLKRYYE